LSYVKRRIGQGKFRELLLERYDTCCLCDVSKSELLVASHIKSWKDSSGKEKLDINNGMLLCPNHDALFDKKFISFDDEGGIILSKELDKKNMIFTNIQEDSKLKFKVTEEMKVYLKFHRKTLK
jgi:predicted restriction endonuclease